MKYSIKLIRIPIPVVVVLGIILAYMLYLSVSSPSSTSVYQSSTSALSPSGSVRDASNAFLQDANTTLFDPIPQQTPTEDTVDPTLDSALTQVQ